MVRKIFRVMWEARAPIFSRRALIVAQIVALLGSTSIAYGEPRRIVSLAPSLTDTLIALGAGDRLVGINAIDKKLSASIVPAGAQVVGSGPYDLDLERIIFLKPDLLVAASSRQIERRMEIFDQIPTRYFDQAASIEAILDSIDQIGAILNLKHRADTLRATLEARLEALKERAEEERAKKLKALISIGRDLGLRKITRIHSASVGSYLSEIVELIGARNVIGSDRLALKMGYPTISIEGALLSDPDVIIDFIAADPFDESSDELRARSIESWSVLFPGITDGKKRLVLIIDPRALIPGPRFIEIAESIARALFAE